MADCSHTYCWSYANCQFGVRTQAERADDDHVWRETAESRPGYATWPDTRAGSPSWWLRHAVGVQTADGRLYAPQDVTLVFPDPHPVDGETCKRWCGFCHLGTDAPAPTPAPPPFPGVPPAAEADEPETWCVCGAPDSGPCPRCLPADAVARAVELPATMRQRIDFDIAPDPVVPQRRRWWHRYTRRTR